jgi:hypothetical protein
MDHLGATLEPKPEKNEPKTGLFRLLSVPKSTPLAD